MYHTRNYNFWKVWFLIWNRCFFLPWHAKQLVYLIVALVFFNTLLLFAHIAIFWLNPFWIFQSVFSFRLIKKNKSKFLHLKAKLLADFFLRFLFRLNQFINFLQSMWDYGFQFFSVLNHFSPFRKLLCRSDDEDDDMDY